MKTSSIPHGVDIKLKPLSCTTFTAYRQPTNPNYHTYDKHCLCNFGRQQRCVPVWCNTIDNDIEGLGIDICAKIKDILLIHYLPYHTVSIAGHGKAQNVSTSLGFRGL